MSSAQNVAAEVAEKRPPGLEGRRSRRRGGGNRIGRQGPSAHVFLAPWLLGLVGVTALPLLASLWLSFTNYNLLSPPRWIGLGNYSNMMADDRFWNAVSVTLRYVFISVPLQLAFALLLAMVLDKGVRGLTLYRSAYYLPSLLGSSVAVSILWREVFGVQGIVNTVLGVFGVEAASWLQDPSRALSTLIVLNVWTFGAPMIIFLAGLRQIPQQYYEAAEVDGAGAFSTWWRVTIPLLTPIIFFNLILQVIGSFQAFTQAHIISGGRGGPVDSTLFYTLYLYQQGFRNFSMGYASALAWVLLIAVALITALNFWAAKYWVFYGDE